MNLPARASSTAGTKHVLGILKTATLRGHVATSSPRIMCLPVFAESCACPHLQINVLGPICRIMCLPASSKPGPGKRGLPVRAI
eukprot:1159117-Pelagomonas_calceolata.AAC.17